MWFLYSFASYWKFFPTNVDSCKQCILAMNVANSHEDRRWNVFEKMLCAATLGKTDICKIDSGGPLVCKKKSGKDEYTVFFIRIT